MKPSLKTLLSGCGAVALAAFWSGTAMAQYYDDGYNRRQERPRYDRGYDRGYDQGRRDRGYRGDDGYRGGYGRGNPVNRMSIDEQKQALKNHRDAQKKAIKRGYVIP
ncbi:hypothetical protein B6S44_11715 [Bosea sp. Tri-44]|uniref:hypothetical protein n=1 Tax=Bosea sp. Tri-44 TaxID=1972137 RepID=UPI00100E612E|nr:hypothetical protein [Bosea sp. Tri-44]RXT55267.1 hypothetical protein B6S44_11715 [Bosea sp. Tri-44]